MPPAAADLLHSLLGRLSPDSDSQHSSRGSPLRNGYYRIRCVGLVMLSVIPVILMGWVWARGTPKAPSAAVAMRDFPISIRPQPRPCLSIPIADLEEIRNQVQPVDARMSTSLYLHALRACGPGRVYHRGKLSSSDETLRLFADDAFSRRIFGTPLMVQTPFGIRCTPKMGKGAKESHRDFCLAVLSEQELPASFPMQVDGKSYTFRDFLADSIANFHLGQEEIEWSALAYALWLPPARTWTNKFGELFSFDDMALELMERPLKNATCTGAHVVQALIVLSRVDAEVCPVLSPSVRSELDGHLQEVVQTAKSTQAADGSWDVDWHKALTQDSGHETARKTYSVETGTSGGRLLATSHIVEWMLLLPDASWIPDERIYRAGQWLHHALKDVDPEFVADHFCPCTHGAIVLQLIRKPRDEVAAAQSPDIVPVSAFQEEKVQ